MPQLRALTALTIGLLTVSATPQMQAQSPANAPKPTQPVAYASVAELNGILDQVHQTSLNMQADLEKARIDRWKIDAATKQHTHANVDSIQRNLRSALPEIVSQLQSAPEDLAATFKLYRNLDALYDVFGSVAELAGAFGSKDEFQSLGNDLNALEGTRRSLGERMQNLAAAKETELTQLRGQIKALQAAAPPPAPKKIIVDDTEPPKKPVKKKPKPATTTPTAPPPASPSPSAQPKSN